MKAMTVKDGVYERLIRLVKLWGHKPGYNVSDVIDRLLITVEDGDWFWADVRSGVSPEPEIERPPEPDRIPVVFCEPTGVIVRTATGWLMVVPRLGHSQVATSEPRISSSVEDFVEGECAGYPPKLSEPIFTNPKDREDSTNEAGLPYPQRLKERVDNVTDWLVRLDQRMTALASEQKAAFDVTNDHVLPRLGADEDRVSDMVHTPVDQWKRNEITVRREVFHDLEAIGVKMDRTAADLLAKAVPPINDVTVQDATVSAGDLPDAPLPETDFGPRPWQVQMDLRISALADELALALRVIDGSVLPQLGAVEQRVEDVCAYDASLRASIQEWTAAADRISVLQRRADTTEQRLAQMEARITKLERP